MNAIAADSVRPVYLVDGLRTPFLKAKGKTGPFTAADLAVAAGRSLLLRQPFSPRDLDEVILGCVLPAADEANIARIAALRMGCGERVTAWTVQRNCASGMQSVDTAVRAILAGRTDLVMAGGVEAMSRAPIQFRTPFADWLMALSRVSGFTARLVHLARFRPGLLRPVITLLKGLTDPVAGLSMGQTAEVVAERFGVQREAMDAFAAESHRRLARAQDEGIFDHEIVPLFDMEGQLLERDDGLYRESDEEKLSQLRPVFDRPFGTVTAGNSAQITDGACWLLVASEKAVERHRLTPLARVHPAHWAGLPPEEMGLGPAHAIARLMRHHQVGVDGVDRWEINEAFAGQVLASMAALNDPDYCREELALPQAAGMINPARLNVDGGAISVGHPVGASGARIVLHLARVLQRLGGGKGVASLCIGGGQGGAMLLEGV